MKANFIEIIFGIVVLVILAAVFVRSVHRIIDETKKKSVEFEYIPFKKNDV